MGLPRRHCNRLLVLILPMHVCLLPLLVMMLVMLAVPHVSVGRNEEVTREVVLQEVSRDWHAMALSIGRGHGGAVGLSQAATPRGVHSICACPPVMPLLRPATLVWRRKPICICSPLLCRLGLPASICTAIGQRRPCCRRGLCSRGLCSKGPTFESIAEPSSV